MAKAPQCGLVHDKKLQSHQTRLGVVLPGDLNIVQVPDVQIPLFLVH